MEAERRLHCSSASSGDSGTPCCVSERKRPCSHHAVYLNVKDNRAVGWGRDLVRFPHGNAFCSRGGGPGVPTAVCRARGAFYSIYVSGTCPVVPSGDCLIDDSATRDPGGHVGVRRGAPNSSEGGSPVREGRGQAPQGGLQNGREPRKEPVLRRGGRRSLSGGFSPQGAGGSTRRAKPWTSAPRTSPWTLVSRDPGRQAWSRNRRRDPHRSQPGPGAPAEEGASPTLVPRAAPAGHPEGRYPWEGAMGQWKGLVEGLGLRKQLSPQRGARAACL